MKTLLFFESAAQSVPQSTAWYLADLGEYLGKQELYARQAPQKLKALKEHAIIESAVSFNTKSSSLAVSEDTIRKLHRLVRGGIGDAGEYKRRESDITERYPDGRVRIRFKTVTANATQRYMKLLVKAWQDCLKNVGRIH